jgi:hypothetical protein
MTLIKFASVALAVLGFGTAGIAAWHWFKASVLPYPKGDDIMYAKETDRRILLGIAQDITRRSGTLNSRAAIWTGVSALLSAISSVIGAVS